MNSRQRLLTAWSFKEPDRVPIELKISTAARNMLEAKDIVKFVDNEADNFHGFPAADFGFMGLKTEYHEEVIEDIPGNFRRIKRIHKTEAGEFYAITKHNYDELDDLDYHWERRYIHTLEEMQKLACSEHTYKRITSNPLGAIPQNRAHQSSEAYRVMEVCPENGLMAGPADYPIHAVRKGRYGAAVNVTKLRQCLILLGKSPVLWAVSQGRLLLRTPYMITILPLEPS